MTTDQITAASNGLWFGGAFLIVFLILRGMDLARRHRRSMGKDALMLCAGALCTSAGVIIHRLYWNLSIWNRHADDAYAVWAIEARHIPSTAVLFITTGVLIATTRYGVSYFGRLRWWLLVFLTLSLCAGGSAYLAS